MMTVVRPLHMTSSASWMECSVVVSRALVASSRSTSLGPLRMVLAMATLCFSPPERRRPLSPTIVSYLSVKRSIASWIDAPLAAATTSASVASGLP
mmetsp:Transcript_27076/g.68247  ORF Transcript_27076/g.68247 Transcript_27076/m.68247 type:complete len:96 (-) Transcript_27076:1008-1295(-)